MYPGCFHYSIKTDRDSQKGLGWITIYQGIYKSRQYDFQYRQQDTPLSIKLTSRCWIELMYGTVGPERRWATPHETV